jgi:hypothetical protein
MLGITFLFIQINEYVNIGFAPQDSAQGTIPRALLGARAPRRRGPRDLLALRRRHVDHRVPHRLHPLRPGAVARPSHPGDPLNPLRSEENAFRFFLIVLATALAVGAVVLLLRSI